MVKKHLTSAIGTYGCRFVLGPKYSTCVRETSNQVALLLKKWTTLDTIG